MFADNECDECGAELEPIDAQTMWCPNCGKKHPRREPEDQPISWDYVR